MTEERRECSDRRGNDRRQLNRRGDGGWRVSPEGRRSEERRSEGRRTAIDEQAL
ncbi:MAG: hypothetical protein ACI9B8_003782 [Sulfitobacter sp.]|jgi:hypothetical protein